MSQAHRPLSLIVAICLILLTGSRTPRPSQQIQGGRQPIINLNLLVMDSSNHPVSDVKREEISLFEDDVPQTIKSFSLESPPIVYGIAIDASGSFKNILPSTLDAAKIIIDHNQPGDETFLAQFVSSEHINTIQEFTSDKAKLFDAMSSYVVEGGQTSLLDAVYVSVEHIAQYKKNDDVPRRRALILMTDGEERDSYYRKDKLLDLLRSEDVQVFVLGVVVELDDAGGAKSRRAKAIKLLNSLAQESGGLALFPKSAAELGKAAKELMSYLSTQYVIGYAPSDGGRKKERRKISVTVADIPGHDKRTAVTRASYKISRREAQVK
jgi:Ca-activated chloride channel family protein